GQLELLARRGGGIGNGLEAPERVETVVHRPACAAQLLCDGDGQTQGVVADGSLVGAARAAPGLYELACGVAARGIRPMPVLAACALELLGCHAAQFIVNE